jgi:CheY-like chemotaxis protein
MLYNQPKKKVLLVDDDSLALGLLVEVFKQKYGSQVVIEKAMNADEADEYIQECLAEGRELPELIVSDWMMPGRRGDEFLRMVYARFPGIPLVLHSGVADEETVQHINKHTPLVASLRKPWDGRTSGAKIDEVLLRG